MNRLANLLINLNRERLPDDYIQTEIDSFIHDLKLELGAEIIPEITNIQTNKSSTVFCTCTTAMIPTCISKNTCIKYP